MPIFFIRDKNVIRVPTAKIFRSCVFCRFFAKKKIEFDDFCPDRDQCPASGPCSVAVGRKKKKKKVLKEHGEHPVVAGYAASALVQSWSWLPSTQAEYARDEGIGLGAMIADNG